MTNKMTNNGGHPQTSPLRSAGSPPGAGVALVLAPGGLPGIEAHVGAFQALEAANVKIDGIFGCSAGAVVGSLIATGMPADRLEEILLGLSADQLVRHRFLRWLRIRKIDSLYDPTPICELLEELLPESFRALRIPLAVSATEVPSGEPALFDELAGVGLREAVLASMSIPAFWPPVTIGGRRYVDGGVSDSIVMPRTVDSYERVIVIDLVDRDREEDTRNVLGLARWAVGRLVAKEARSTHIYHAAADNVDWIRIDTTGYSTLEFSPGHLLVEAARKQVALELNPAFRI